MSYNISTYYVSEILSKVDEQIVKKDYGRIFAVLMPDDFLNFREKTRQLTTISRYPC